MQRFTHPAVNLLKTCDSSERLFTERKRFSHRALKRGADGCNSVSSEGEGNCVQDEADATGTHHRFYRPALDAVRFCAFLAVFGHHVLPRQPGASALHTLADACGFGLYLFFVLSAFLIALKMLQEYDITGALDVKAFFARRILRIWPLYLLGLGIGALRAWSHGVLFEQKVWFVAALLLAGNAVHIDGILMSHLWSISVEEQFYLLFPLPARFGRHGLLGAAALSVLLANIALVYLALRHATLDTTVWFNSFACFEMFAAGVLLALLDHRLQTLKTPVALLAVASSLGLALFVQVRFHLKLKGYAGESPMALCLAYLLLALACCLFIVGMQRLPTWRPITYLGKISYGLYVFHIPAIALIGSRLGTFFSPVASLAVTVAAAALSYATFEKPLLQLKRQFDVVATCAAQ